VIAFPVMVIEGLMSIATVTNIHRNPWAEELEQVFEQHYQLVYRTAYSLTGSAQDAEDVLQTIFLRLLARETHPDLKKDPEPYLYRAAFNLSMDVIRSRQRQVLTNDVAPFDIPVAPTSSDESDEMDRRLHQAIADLNPASAQIVILRYVHGKSLSEIAKLLGTTRGTVAVSLFRSRARLKKLMQAPLKEKSS
jgi:RNA polymerase sigma-70 factor (ECF subfamily)